MTPRDTEDINLLSSFLGIRDVPELTREALLAFWNAPRADLLVLFGGTILCGADDWRKPCSAGSQRIT